MVHNPSLRFEEGGASFDRNPVQNGTESSFIETPNHVRASMSPPLCSTAIAAETEWKAVSLQHEWIGCPVDSADATLCCCEESFLVATVGAAVGLVSGAFARASPLFQWVCATPSTNSIGKLMIRLMDVYFEAFSRQRPDCLCLARVPTAQKTKSSFWLPLSVVCVIREMQICTPLEFAISLAYSGFDRRMRRVSGPVERGLKRGEAKTKELQSSSRSRNHIYIGLRDITPPPIMQIQMEKKMGNEMETGVIWYLIQHI